MERNFRVFFISTHAAAAVVVDERSICRLLLMMYEKHLITTLWKYDVGKFLVRFLLKTFHVKPQHK